MGAHHPPTLPARVLPMPQIEKNAPADWKALCEETKRRLDIAESSLVETRKSADEMRGRMTKYKTRLDSAQSENNKLQARVVELTAQVEAQNERLARQDIVKQKVHQFRQSIIDGPLWELFAEL